MGCAKVNQDNVKSILTRIIISPNSTSTTLGSSINFSATGYDQNNQTITITPTWEVLGGIGTITNAGVFTATATGSGYVNSIIGNITAQATVTVTPASSPTPTPANIILKGSIISTSDAFGNVRFFGELQNSGGSNASFIKITFTLKNPSSVVIGTDMSYIIGTVLKTSTGTTNTCLKPGEYGAFEVITSIPYSSVFSYDTNINWETYSTTTPSAFLEIYGAINDTFDFFGNKKYLGEIKNNSVHDVTFAQIYFIMKNSYGNIVDIASSYVTGTDIAAGQIKSFEVLTSTHSSEVSSYYNRFDWSE